MLLSLLNEFEYGNIIIRERSQKWKACELYEDNSWNIRGVLVAKYSLKNPKKV
jgi:hypothetical protein